MAFSSPSMCVSHHLQHDSSHHSSSHVECSRKIEKARPQRSVYHNKHSTVWRGPAPGWLRLSMRGHNEWRVLIITFPVSVITWLRVYGHVSLSHTGSGVTAPNVTNGQQAVVLNNAMQVFLQMDGAHTHTHLNEEPVTVSSVG